MEKSFSWTFVDWFFLILCLRVVYISTSRGVLRESFKVTGLLTGSFFAFQYYPFLSGALSSKIPFLNKEYFFFFSFLSILLPAVLIFTISRILATFLFRKGVTGLKERILSFSLGAFRASLWASIIIFLLHLSPLDSERFCHSISYRIFRNIGPKIYLVSFKVYNKFDPRIALNKEVEEYYEADKFL